MSAKIISIIVVTLTLSADLLAKTPFEKLVNIVSKTTGIEQVSIDQKILPKKSKDQDAFINKILVEFETNKANWERSKKNIKDNKLKIKQIIFSDQDAFSIDLAYSALFDGMNVDLYVEGPSTDISALISYLAKIKKILLATDIQKLDEVLSYRAPGEKICINQSPATGLVVDYLGIINIWNIDVEKLKISNFLDENGTITLNMKTYLMSKKLKEKPDAPARIQGVLYDEEMNSNDKVASIHDILDQENLYIGQFRSLFSEPRDNKIILERMLSVVSANGTDFGEIEYRDDELTEILGYYDLKVALTCFIAKLTQDEIYTVDIDMGNKLDTPFSKEASSIKLNMEDFFYR